MDKTITENIEYIFKDIVDKYGGDIKPSAYFEALEKRERKVRIAWFGWLVFVISLVMILKGMR